MNDIPGTQMIKSPDIEKINFWKEKGRLATIPYELLSLSGYIEDYAESEVVGEKDGQVFTGKVHNIPEGTEILFWSPQDRKEKNDLQEILSFLEEKKQSVALVDFITRKFQDMGRKDDVLYLLKEKNRIKSPQIMINGRINAFLDTLRFKVSEVGMTELRQYPSLKRFSIEEKERELNND